MTPATITPLRCGNARFSWRGIDETFPTVFDAVVAAAAHQIPAEVLEVERFEPTPIVLATSPALRVV